MSGDPVYDLLSLEAEERSAAHDGQANQRKLTDNYELVGLAGEVEFGRRFRQPVNWERLSGGDRGIDFTIAVGLTVDVKTACKPGHLLVEQGKVVADIYALAGYSDLLRRAELLGWEYGTVVARAPLEPWAGAMNHAIPRAALRPMAELERRVMHLQLNGRGP